MLENQVEIMPDLGQCLHLLVPLFLCSFFMQESLVLVLENFFSQMLKLNRFTQSFVQSNKFLQKRNLSIHEHLSIGLLKKYGITVARGSVAKTAAEVEKIAQDLKCQDVVVKAQVLAGGRGKGHFDSGMKGGVKLANS
jgi:hypothetical protein